MNPVMKECLERAVRERAAEHGRKRVPGFLLDVSFKLGPDGFDRATIWRALEIATEKEKTP